MRTGLMLTALLVPAGAAWSGDVPSFRGGGAGVAAKAAFPYEWGKDKNIAWKAEVPGGGWSAPVVAGDKVFLTTAVSGDYKPKDFTAGVSDPRSMIPLVMKGPNKTFTFEVLCYDRASGKQLWRKKAAEAKPRYAVHPSNSYATETPATDGQRVYVLFAAVGTFAAYGLDGKELWKKDFGAYKTSAGFGPGSSLAVGGGLVFVQYDNDEKSFVAAFDGKTGKQAWRVDRKTKTSWSTPLLWKNKLRTELVVCGAGAVTSYDPKTGKQLWTMTRVGGQAFAASPTADDERVYFGNSGPTSPSPLYAVKAGASGDITLEGDATSNEFVAWSRNGTGPGLPSPVAWGGYLYTVGNTLVCHDAKTGEVVYKKRLPRMKTVVSSMWLADGRLYVLDEAGRCLAVKPGPKFELLATNVLADTFWSTPAVDGDALLVRGLGSLYCIRK